MRFPTLLASSIVTVLFAAFAVSTVPEERPPSKLIGDEGPYLEVDFSTIDRRIAREPDYVSTPRYAMFVFGPKAEARMWAVLDRSDAALPYYDVLYFDLDGDGDLTDPGERFHGAYREHLEASGAAITIRVDSIRVPGTTLVHTDLRVHTARRKGDPSAISFRMRWRGREPLSGGRGLARAGWTTWSHDVATAPIFRPTPHGTLSFGLFVSDPEGVTLRSGFTEDVDIMIGSPGSGVNALTVLHEDFLDLEKDALTVTLIGEDENGDEVRGERTRLKRHC
ncbi:MAG: hypothetical protein AAF957_11740 [Planctomycetota bacterium]